MPRASRIGTVIVGLVLVAAAARCTTESNPLAPYAGERPLTVLTVTQSFTPQLQWVGGRVAAVGVNRDSTAALDASLVWLRAVDEDAIGAPVTVGEPGADDLVREFGGIPLDSLEHGATYTFWMAERDVFDADLDPASFDGFNFVDTTVTLDLRLAGRTLGGVDVEITIVRDETLVGTRYVADWTPAVPFRRLAVTQGRVGSFTDLAWHVVLPDSVEDSIRPPVVLGETPPGAEVAVEWAGFAEPAIYIFWMANADWEERFGPRSAGYAYFQIFDSNFEP